MRVWLVDERDQSRTSSLEALLRQLENHVATELRLLGGSPFEPDFVEAMGKLVPDLLDLLVINEQAWPDEVRALEVFNLGVAVVVVTAPDRAQRFQSLADL